MRIDFESSSLKMAFAEESNRKGSSSVKETNLDS